VFPRPSQAQDGFAFSAGDRLAHDWGLSLVWRVETISSLPPLTTSQAQPLPKRPMPGGFEFFLEGVKTAERGLDCRSASLPDGCAAGLWAQSVSKTWNGSHGRRRCCAPPPRMSAGDGVQIADEVLDGFLFSRSALPAMGLVDVGDVRGMVFVVVDFHRHLRRWMVRVRLWG